MKQYTVDKNKQYTIEDLLDILRVLRGENGCPWDQVQTHESIKNSLIEECYETIDALNAGNDPLFANELGDVLLQVAFHAELARERGAFDFNTVVNEICNKLIFRHTHVFGGDQAADAQAALGSWEKNKKKEKGLNSYQELLNDVARYLPALMRAEKVQRKASSVGFDWADVTGAIEKVGEELGELREAITSGVEKDIAEEYGDLLFSIVNIGRFVKVTPEIALADATDKFISRFAKMEQLAIAQNQDLGTMNLEEMDELWNRAKTC